MHHIELLCTTFMCRNWPTLCVLMNQILCTILSLNYTPSASFSSNFSWGVCILHSQPMIPAIFLCELMLSFVKSKTPNIRKVKTLTYYYYAEGRSLFYFSLVTAAIKCPYSTLFQYVKFLTELKLQKPSDVEYERSLLSSFQKMKRHYLLFSIESARFGMLIIIIHKAICSNH